MTENESSKPQTLRVAVLSSTEFGYRCIKEALLPLYPTISLAGIITTPKQIDISYSEEPVDIVRHVDFEDLTEETEFGLHELKGNISSENYLNVIHHWQPDLLLALGWYYIVPRTVRESVPLGCVGIHASLLPKYRGGAPIPWAIINGERETGVTLFYFDGGIDSGDIIAQEAFPIRGEDTCATVYQKAEAASVDILREYLPKLADGTAPRIPQDESQATHFPQRSPEDGEIDWSWSAKEIKDFIRAQTHPYPGAYTYINGKKIVIWDADIYEVK